MSKITLQEAYELATKGPLTVNKFVMAKDGSPSPSGRVGFSPSGITFDSYGDKRLLHDAALLAHARNVLQEVVAVLQEVAADFDGMVLMPPGLADKVRAVLAKASTVEIPE